MPNDGDFSPISFQDNYLFLEVGAFLPFPLCPFLVSLQPFSDKGFNRQWSCVIQAHKNMPDHLIITLNQLYDLQTLDQHNKPRLALINLFGGRGGLRVRLPGSGDPASLVPMDRAS